MTECKKLLGVEHERLARCGESAYISSSLDGDRQSSVLFECNEESLSLLIGEDETGDGKEKSGLSVASPHWLVLGAASKLCCLLEEAKCTTFPFPVSARRVLASWGSKLLHVLNGLQVPCR